MKNKNNWPLIIVGIVIGAALTPVTGGLIWIVLFGIAWFLDVKKEKENPDAMNEFLRELNKDKKTEKDGEQK